MLGYVILAATGFVLVCATVLPLFISEGRDGYRDREVR